MRIKHRRLGAMFALVLVACARTAVLPSTVAEAVPVFREPHHHVVYENPLVRVLDVRVQSGDTTLFHVHSDRHIGVVIAGARTWDQALGHKRSVSSADSVGAVFDNESASLPYTHRVANVDTTAFRYIVGQLLASSGIVAPALPTDATMWMERETTRARVYRIALAPGQSTREHRHAQPGLTIQVGPGTLQLDGTQSVAASPHPGAGAWWWRSAGHRHTLRNVGSESIALVEIDWK